MAGRIVYVVAPRHRTAVGRRLTGARAALTVACLAVLAGAVTVGGVMTTSADRAIADPPPPPPPASSPAPVPVSAPATTSAVPEPTTTAAPTTTRRPRPSRSSAGRTPPSWSQDSAEEAERRLRELQSDGPNSQLRKCLESGKLYEQCGG